MKTNTHTVTQVVSTCIIASTHRPLSDLSLGIPASRHLALGVRQDAGKTDKHAEGVHSYKRRITGKRTCALRPRSAG